MSVLSVSLSPTHNFTKSTLPSINLLAGLGIEGDCHAGTTVQHRSRLKIRPVPANLRQVHLIHSEVFDAILRSDNGKSEKIKPGDLGENVTTSGIDLLALGEGTKLHFLPKGQTIAKAGEHPVVVVTGLRNPCPQIEKFRPGLQEKFIVRDGERNIVGRLAGVMSTVERGGEIKPGMVIQIEKPAVHKALVCV